MQSIPAMNVEKAIYLQPENPNATVFNVHTVYTSDTGGGLLQEYAETVASDTFGKRFRRFSSDNGKTWSPPELVFTPRETSEGMEREGEGALLREPATGWIFRFTNRHLYPEITFTKDVMKLTTIGCEVSRDEGRTFSAPRQLIVRGGTPRQWAPGIEYGTNSAMISFSSPFVDGRGRIILPAQWLPRILDSMDTYLVPIEAICFVGETNSRGEIEWERMPPVSGDLTQTPRGLFEPTIAEVGDGRLLMICRGSNGWDAAIPGRKWISTSNDGGNHWSTPRPLGYEDGALFFSPSSGSALIRSSRNGRLYWIGNITPTNPLANLPRRPLVIAQVDAERACLIRSTVEIIDDAEGDEDLRLSNFRVYEDRETGDFLVTLARSIGNNEDPTPAHQIRISLEAPSKISP